VNNWVSGKEAGLLFGAEIKLRLAKSPGVQAGMRIIEKSTEPYFESAESRSPSSRVTFEIDGTPFIRLCYGLLDINVDLDWSHNFLKYVKGELQKALEPQEKEKLEKLETLLIRDIGVFSNRRFFVEVLNASLFFKHIGFALFDFSFDTSALSAEYALAHDIQVILNSADDQSLLRLRSGFPVIGNIDTYRPPSSELLSSIGNLQPSGVDILRALAKLLNEAWSALDDSIHQINHVEPIRSQPDPFTVGGFDSILNTEKLNFLNRWLQRLTDGRYSYEPSVGVLSDDDGRSEVNVSFQLIQDHLLGVKIGFNETGTGLSQILPVIVAAFDLAPKDADTNRNRLCIIEQPELHLHPKMQAEVGSMLVDAHKHTGMQFIIETHSENLLLRLQKLVRSGVISSDDLTVIYVEPLEMEDSEDSKTQWSNVMTNLSLDDAGDVIDPFPESFADLRIQDLLG
jgi:hypothetical protein